MTRTRITATLLALVLATAAVACDDAGSGPAGAAKEWLVATLEQDGNRAARLVCDSMQGDQMVAATVFAAFEVIGTNLLGVGLGTDFDLDDLDFKTTSERGDRATVHVSGDVLISVLGVSQPTDIDDYIEMVKEDGQWKVCN